MAKAMSVGDLLDTLAAIDTAREDVDPPMTLEEWRAMPITVRGADDDGGGFCGYLYAVEVETGCNEFESLVFDATNEPEDA
jgi:hypothetical protein